MKIKATKTHYNKKKNIDTWTNTNRQTDNTRQQILAHKADFPLATFFVRSDFFLKSDWLATFFEK